MTGNAQKVFEGTVATVYDNYSGSEILINKGGSGQVVGDGETTRLTCSNKIMTLDDLKALPQITLKFLVNSINNGKELCFTKDEICSFIDETETTFTTIDSTSLTDEVAYNGTVGGKQDSDAAQSGTPNESNAISSNMGTNTVGSKETSIGKIGGEETTLPKQNTVKEPGQVVTKNEPVATQAPHETTKVATTTKSTTTKASTTLSKRVNITIIFGKGQSTQTLTLTTGEKVSASMYSGWLVADDGTQVIGFKTESGAIWDESIPVTSAMNGMTLYARWG
jgi:hypothetical protein